MSDAAKKRPPMSEETKRKMSITRKGKKLSPRSEETKKKISENKKEIPCAKKEEKI